MGVSSLPKTVTRQRRGCDLNPGPSAPESITLTTRLPSHPQFRSRNYFAVIINRVSGERIAIGRVSPSCALCLSPLDCFHSSFEPNWQPTFDLGNLQVGWLDSRVVSLLDSGAEGPGFKSQLRRCRVTVLDKLFTPIVPLPSPSSEIGSSLLRVAGVTAGLAESNCSLLPGL